MFYEKQDNYSSNPLMIQAVMMAAERRRRQESSDPVLFAERCGVALDDWQRRVLRSGSRQLLLNCSRQSGKSTVSALLAIWTAAYFPGSLSLIVSPSERQSVETFRKALAFFRTIEREAPADAESVLRLQLANGSRIISLPGRTDATVRGYSAVDLLILDEASRIEDDLYQAMRPMMAVSGGRTLALSTPFGCRGWWYEAWQRGEAWEKFLVPATACPRIPAEFLAEEKRTMPPWVYSAEYECVFGDNELNVFDSADVEAAFSSSVQGVSFEELLDG